MAERHAASFRTRLRRARDSSAAVSAGRRLSKGSVLRRGFAAFRRSASPRSSYLWSRVRPVGPPRDFRQATRILADSRLCLFVEAVLRVTMRAWSDSTTREYAVGSLASLERWQYVRLVGWTILVSTVVRIALRPQAGSVQLAGWLLALSLGVALLWGARPIAAAWAGRGRRSASRTDPSS